MFQEPQLRPDCKALAELLEQLYLSLERCPKVLSPLMNTHRSIVGKCLSEGLSGTITWNMTNRDTFLHCAGEAIRVTMDYSRFLSRKMEEIATSLENLAEYQFFTCQLVSDLEALVS